MLTAEARAETAPQGKLSGRVFSSEQLERDIEAAMGIIDETPKQFNARIQADLDAMALGKALVIQKGYVTRNVTEELLQQGRLNRTVKAPLEWRMRNWLRGLVHGDWFVPILPGIIKLCRRLKPVPIIGPLLSGSIGALGVMTGDVYATVIKADGSLVQYGLVGRHVIATAGKVFLASAFNNDVEPEIMKYHGFGTGTNAAAAGDTALQTELTTEYATNNTRPTGSQADSSNTYTTVGTLAPDATVAITEWGLFSQAANSGGTLWDRQVFSAINMISGDTLAVTYVLTIA